MNIKSQSLNSTVVTSWLTSMIKNYRGRALKGQYNLAQSNALGTIDHEHGASPTDHKIATALCAG